MPATVPTGAPLASVTCIPTLMPACACAIAGTASRSPAAANVPRISRISSFLTLDRVPYHNVADCELNGSSAGGGSRDDRHEVRGLEACTSDERTVDVRDRENFGCVGGLHRTSVEDPDLVA